MIINRTVRLFSSRFLLFNLYYIIHHYMSRCPACFDVFSYMDYMVYMKLIFYIDFYSEQAGIRGIAKSLGLGTNLQVELNR